MERPDSPVSSSKKRKANTTVEDNGSPVRPRSPPSGNVNLEDALRLRHSLIHRAATEDIQEATVPETNTSACCFHRQWPMGSWQQVETNVDEANQSLNSQNSQSPQWSRASAQGTERGNADLLSTAGSQMMFPILGLSFQQVMQMKAGLPGLISYPAASQVNTADQQTFFNDQYRMTWSLENRQATGKMNHHVPQQYMMASNYDARTTEATKSIASIPQASDSQTSSTTAMRVRPYDVLLGRGSTYRYNPGNVRMHLVASLHREAYIKGDREVKASIRQKIVHFIKFQSGDKNGRFLKFDKVANEWLEVSDSEAQDKIGHAIRDGSSTKTQPNVVNDPEILREMEQSLLEGTRNPLCSNDGSSSGTKNTAATILELREEIKFLAGLFNGDSSASSSSDGSDDSWADKKLPGRTSATDSPSSF